MGHRFWGGRKVKTGLEINLSPSHFFLLLENPDKMLKYAAKVI